MTDLVGNAGYRPEIDGLRSVAVLGVLFYHVGFSWMPGGYVGVDVFFVISGYLITRLLMSEVSGTGRIDFSNFYLRRVRRLLPALVSTILFTFIVGFLIFPPALFTDLSGSAISALLSLSNFYFWHQTGYFDSSNLVKPLLHTWSLSVEEQFYFVWPLLLFVCAKLRAVWTAILMLGVVSLILSVLHIDNRADIYFLTHYRVFEFALGAGVLWFEKLGTGKAFPNLAFLIGIALIIGTMALYTEATPFPSYGALPPCLGAVLIIHSGGRSNFSVLLTNKLAVGLGVISYSLYLVHWPIIVFSNYLSTAPPTDLTRLELCALAIALAVLLYFLIELTFRAGRRGNRERWQIGLVAISTIAISAVPPTNAWANGGWPWRYSPEIRSLVTAENYGVSLPQPPSECFMHPETKPEDFSPDCYVVRDHTKKNILLLGDSTAWHLYAGLYGRLGKDANILVWTGSLCAAIPDYAVATRPNCIGSNKYFFEKVLKNNRYDLVIVAALGSGPALLSGLKNTLARLSAASMPYLLIGQIIRYREPPIKIVAKYGLLRNLDERMTKSLTVSCNHESGFDKLADAEHFFSMKRVLCRDGKPIYQQGGGLLQRDQFHLSRRGSIFVADRLVPRLRKMGYP